MIFINIQKKEIHELKDIDKKTHLKHVYFLLIFGFIIRLIYLIININTNNLHCDEVMLMLNAKEIVNNGTDILGNSFPYNFNTWLSGGQSCIGTYLVSIMYFIFGENLYALRMPIVILSCISLIYIYKITNEITHNNKIKELILLVFVSSPFLISQSVWNLDCLYSIPFFLFGLYRLVYSINNKKYINLIIAMFWFALSVHSYMLNAIPITLFLLIYAILLLAKKKIKFRYIIISIFSYVIFLTPLIVYMLVQFNIVKPITIFGVSFYSADSSEGRMNNILLFNFISHNYPIINIITNYIGYFILNFLEVFLGLSVNYNNFEKLAIYSNIINYHYIFMIPITWFGLIAIKKNELIKSALYSSFIFLLLLSPFFYEALYRVMFIFLFFLFITGYGLFKAYNLIKLKISYELFFRGICVMLCSLTLFSTLIYSNKLNNIDELKLRCNSHIAVIDAMRDKNKSTIIIEDKQDSLEGDFFDKIGVFAEYYIKDDNKLVFKNYFPNICNAALIGKLKDKRMHQNITKDGRISFIPLEEIKTMTADYYFTVSKNAKKQLIKILPENYKYKNIDEYYTVFYKCE